VIALVGWIGVVKAKEAAARRRGGGKPTVDDGSADSGLR
jgi:hypothetical protein